MVNAALLAFFAENVAVVAPADITAEFVDSVNGSFLSSFQPTCVTIQMADWGVVPALMGFGRAGY